MKHINGLSPSRQSYLAEILSLEAELGCARQSEIAWRIGVNRSSVTAALRTLAECALIRYEPYEAVTLTPTGKQMAERIKTRRCIIQEYLVTAFDMAEGAADDAARHMQFSVPDVIIDQFSARLGCGDKELSPQRVTPATQNRQADQT